jgi:hypothetical protein
MFEVRVISSGNNIATGKSSSQSSTLHNYTSSLAIDGQNNTFSHTNIATHGSPVWWKVDLGAELPIESVTVLNRWCGSSSDSNGCLCRLSYATFFLMDSKGDVVAAHSAGDTCGQRQLFFDYFVEPTLSPTVLPSFSPTMSLNPTSSLVDDFSLIGDGYCLDESFNYYSSYISSPLPSRYTDTYCLDWCSQNPLPDLVGVQVKYMDYSTYCSCLFSGGLPLGLNMSDYSPAAEFADGFEYGVGPIQTSWGYNNTLCYRYDVSSCVVLLVSSYLFELHILPFSFLQSSNPIQPQS